jgi:hypothetical protein
MSEQKKAAELIRQWMTQNGDYDERVLKALDELSVDPRDDRIAQLEEMLSVAEEALNHYSIAMPSNTMMHRVYRDKDLLRHSGDTPYESVFICGSTAREALAKIEAMRGGGE